MPPDVPAINVFIPASVNQGAASLDSRDLLQFSNGAYFAAQAHSVNGSNFVEVQARAGSLTGVTALNSHVMASTSWQDAFRLSGGSGEAELAITIAWPGLAPFPPGTLYSNTTMTLPPFLPSSWEANYQLRYREITAGAPNQLFDDIPDSTSYQGSLHAAFNEFQGSALYRFNVPYDTWIALEGSLLVSAVNTNKSFASGVSIANIELPSGVTLQTYSGNPLTAPVPEPETWAMLLAGLGIVTAAAHRKATGGKADQA